MPPLGDFSELVRLFPTTFSVELMPPFLIFRVREVPPQPWPLTIAGLPIMITSEESPFRSPFFHGRHGRGPRNLDHLKLRTSSDYNRHVLEQAVKVFDELKQNIIDIYWFGGFWRITVPDSSADLKGLPQRLGDGPCFYRTVSEILSFDPAALHRQPRPQSIEFEDTDYLADDEKALLRPGIMLSSSYFPITENGQTREYFNTTSSGILIADQHGQIFITAAAHGFQKDGNVYHPNPATGRIIGTVVVDELPGTGIAIVKLNPGLRFINETFASDEYPAGSRIKGVTPPYAPHLRVYDEVKMNDPVTGNSEGVIMALGARVVNDLQGTRKLVRHEWHVFEHGDQDVEERRCGAPILDDQDGVVGLFRFKDPTSPGLCLSVSATELREFGYEICVGEHTF